MCLYRVAGGEVEAVDVSVQHQRGDGRVAAEGDAGEWPCGDDLPDLRDEAGACRRICCCGAEVNVFGPVEGLHWAVQAGGCIVENELPDPDRVAICRSVPEFGPAEQAGDVGVGWFGDDLGGWPGLAELAADDDGQVVADAERFVAVVGDVRGRDLQFGEELLQQRAQVFAGRLVQRRQRLIQQQEARLDRQRAGQGNPLAFAAAEPAR